MTAKAPLSYEPAGSSDVTLWIVPTVIDAEAVGVDPPVEQPASVNGAIAVPPRTASDRVRNVDADVKSVTPFYWKRPWRTRVETTGVQAVYTFRSTQGPSTTSLENPVSRMFMHLQHTAAVSQKRTIRCEGPGVRLRCAPARPAMRGISRAQRRHPCAGIDRAGRPYAAAGHGRSGRW